jgi:hypothetical protein
MKADPAKDLFAYLFLMIMIFCFMLMLATHDMVYDLVGDTVAHDAPAGADVSAGTSLTRMDEDGLGHLVRRQGSIFIAYGSRLYSPENDLEALRADGRIRLITGSNNTEKQVLYLEDSPDQQVMLTEYLEAFGHLSSRGIGVAFAERAY